MNKFIPKTELLYKKSHPIDQLDTSDAIKLMIADQSTAGEAVKKVSQTINSAIDLIYKRLVSNNYGRLIYTGAGTSGRIGLQDGVELFPTFNWPKKRVEYILAGGLKALLNSIENAEDDVTAAKYTVKKKMVNSNDVVIGLAARGNTPFTCKVLDEAKNRNALTISISNNPNGEILKYGTVKIVLDTKEETIAGSTRLKAGTAQKICLNTISSMVMIKMGRVKNGFMSNLVPTNEKLRKRKLAIESKLK